jgi:hypothetical protein
MITIARTIRRKMTGRHAHDLVATASPSLPLATVAVVGGGMAAHRFCRQLAAVGGLRQYRLIVFTDESSAPYDRVKLTDFFRTRNPDDLLLDTPDWYQEHVIELRLGHATELEAAQDSHPPKKFLDPRHADRVASLNARLCITCHREHVPELTRPIGVTMPEDYCFRCHVNIGKERPSHVGLGFQTCASSGCHNFHDNRALYEDFLVKHARSPDLSATLLTPARDFAARYCQAHPEVTRHLTVAQHDGPVDRDHDPELLAAWAATAHARAIESIDWALRREQTEINNKTGKEKHDG